MKTIQSCVAGLALLSVCAPSALAQSPVPYPVEDGVVPTEAELDAIEAAFVASLAGGFTAAEPTNASMEPFEALLPEEIGLTWASAYTDPNGAFVAEGIQLAVEGTPLAIQIDTLRAWGFDSDALAARLGGARLTEDLLIADRLELSGIAVVGMAETAAMEGGDEVTVNKAVLSIGRYVAEDFYLGPWEMVPASFDDSDMTEGFNLLQAFVAGQRTFVASYAGFEDFEASFDLLAPGYDGAPQQQTMSLTIGSYGVTDQVGGDIGFSLVSDFALDFYGTDDELGLPLQLGWTADRYAVKDMELDRALGYLARGEMPPTSVTDLMSLGVWIIENEAVSLNDAPYVTNPLSFTVAKDWHWLIPERITSWAKGSTLETRPVVDLMNEVLAAEGENANIPEAVISLMAENGLGTIRSTSGMDYAWSPETGETGLVMDMTLANLFDFDLGFDGAFIDYDTGVASFEPDEYGDIDPGLAWAEASRIDGASVSLTDLGGLTSVANLVIGLSKIYPEMDQLGFSKLSAQELRGVLGGVVVAGAFSVQSEIPEVGRYSLAASNWINQGGTLTISLSPDAPLPLVELLEKLENEDFDTPSQALSYIGLTVTHTPPETPAESPAE